VEPTAEEVLAAADDFMAAGRIGDAAREYRRVLEVDPQSFEANLQLGIATKRMEDARFENERDYSESRGHLTAALDIRADDPRPHFYLGEIEFTLGNYSRTIDRLSVATRLDPSGEAAHEMMGLALLELGRPGEGKAALERTLEINPGNAKANLEIGKLYEKERRNALAIRHLEAALAAGPNLDMATYILQRLYYDEGQYAESEAKCREFLRHYPNDVQSLEILGNIYRLDGRAEDALAVYERLTEIDPDNTAYWSPVIQHFVDNKNHERARVALEESTRHNPYYAFGNVHYGKILIADGDAALEAGNKPEAVRLYSRAIEHLQKARVDDRYKDSATQLLARAESRLSAAR
jgi:tetratricopeptide (TPR) repeat protein